MAVIIVIGLARAGKDTAADYISEKYGYAKYTFSSVLREMIEKRSEKATKEKMLRLGDMIRKQIGMDAVAKLLDKKISEKDNIVLAGPRSIEEINYFRKKFPLLKLVKVSAGKESRFGRKSRIDPQDAGGFYARDERDVETKGFGKVLDAAEIEIQNTGKKGKLFEQIDAMMGKIGHGAANENQ